MMDNGATILTTLTRIPLIIIDFYVNPMDYIRPFMLIAISTCGVLLIHSIRTLNCNISTCRLLEIPISVPCDHRTGCQLMGLTVPLTRKVAAHKTTKVVDVDPCWCSPPSSLSPSSPTTWSWFPTCLYCAPTVA